MASQHHHRQPGLGVEHTFVASVCLRQATGEESRPGRPACPHAALWQRTMHHTPQRQSETMDNLPLCPPSTAWPVAKTHKAWLQPASTGAMRSCPTCGLIRTAIMTSCSVSSWSMVFAIAASFTCLTATSDRLTRKCRPRWLYNRSIYAYACSLAVVSLQLCRISLSASPRSRSWNSLPLSPTAGHHPGGRCRRTV